MTIPYTPGTLYNEAGTFAYYMGMKMVIDVGKSPVIPHIALETFFRNDKGKKFDVLMLDTPQVYSTFPLVVDIHRRACFATGQLLPFHCFGHSTSTARVVIGPVKFHVRVYLPDIATYSKRLASRLEPSQSGLEVMKEEYGRYSRATHISRLRYLSDVRCERGSLMVLFAPSGAGKTHYVRDWLNTRFPDPMNASDIILGRFTWTEDIGPVYIDGDQLVDWPTIPRFWEVMSYDQQTLLALTHMTQILNRTSRLRESGVPVVVLFNTHESVFNMVKADVYRGPGYNPITDCSRNDIVFEGVDDMRTFGSQVGLYAHSNNWPDQLNLTNKG